jgi:urease accessory protein
MTINTLSNTALLNLMTLLSPSFPVGGYVYSHGIEYAVEDGRITNEQDLCVWINAALRHGTGRIDGILFKSAWAAVTENKFIDLKWVIERSDVMRGTKEMGLESQSQGKAFLDTTAQVWDLEKLDQVMEVVGGMEHQPTYPVAVAIVSAASDIPFQASLLAYFHAFSANLVSAGIRLVPLGQVAGQRCMEELKLSIDDMLEATILGKIENLGTAAPIIDWASMQHETQYTRLFRS